MVCLPNIIKITIGFFLNTVGCTIIKWMYSQVQELPTCSNIERWRKVLSGLSAKGIKIFTKQSLLIELWGNSLLKILKSVIQNSAIWWPLKFIWCKIFQVDKSMAYNISVRWLKSKFLDLLHSSIWVIWDCH